MQALIFAAGSGIRLKGFVDDRPKGLVTVNGEPILGRSIELMRSFGIKHYYVVTGYRATEYQKFFEGVTDVSLIHNEAYQIYNNLYTLACAKAHITEDVLLLESDIIYEPKALEQLLAASQSNCLLTGALAHSEDAVYVAADPHFCLQGLSKHERDFNSLSTSCHVLGELVGMTRLSLLAYRALCHLLEHNFDRWSKAEYEQALVEISQGQHPIFCLKSESLRWTEIDTEEHYHKAQRLFSSKCGS